MTPRDSDADRHTRADELSQALTSLGEDDRTLVERAARNGQVIPEPQLALLCARIMEDRVRDIRRRRPYLVGGALLAAIAVAFLLFTAKVPPIGVALVSVLVSLPLIQLILDLGFKRAYEANRARGESVERRS